MEYKIVVEAGQKPESCGECDLIFEYGYDITCRVMNRITRKRRLHPDCPIVELPTDEEMRELKEERVRLSNQAGAKEAYSIGLGDGIVVGWSKLRDQITGQ